MSGSQPETMQDPLAAEADDPKLSVHSLSEFVFCPRAGLCIHEQEGNYEERERRADTSYLPIYFRDTLERRLKMLLTQLWNALLMGIIGAAVCGLALWASGILVFGLASAGCVLLGLLGAMERGYQAYVVTQYLAIWRAAKERLPDPDSTKTQDVYWCELLAGPFTSRQPQAPYTHGPWKLGGTPWRVLQFGELRIPVFLHKGTWRGLFRQHFVRMAAYCRLLEECEGFKSPYGVVLEAGTFHGVTVPNSPRTREALRKELADARRVVRDAEEMNVFPPVPGHGEVCHECPYGEPRPMRGGGQFLRYGSPIRVNDIGGFHSHCGDRFGWVPPHRRVLRRRLVARR